MIAALAAVALAAPCPFAATADEIAGQLDRAEAAYAAADGGAFEDALDEAALSLGCVDRRVPPALAARLHRANGLRQIGSSASDAAIRSFAAARAADAATDLPSTLVPTGHPAHLAWSAPAPRASAPLPQPIRGEIALDGRPARRWNPELPAVVQLLDDAGAATLTRQVAPGEPLPTYDARDPHRPTRLALGGAAAAALAASVGSYAAASSAHAAFWADDPSATRGGLVALQGRTNALYATSVGLGAAALGTGAAAILVGRF